MHMQERIQARMDDKGWKLADLAREADVAKGYLWEILSSEKEKRPSAQTLYSIALALGTTVADLLGRSTKPGSIDAGTIPETLRQFADEANLPEEDIRVLSAIHFRNEQPKTMEDWRFLWESAGSC